MATYYNLLAIRNQPVESIFAATDVAEANRLRERAAATKIQSVARMRQCRKRFLYVRSSLVNIQRVFRGYCGRKRTLRVELQQFAARRRQTLNVFATVIQAAFRGFFSRKWRCNFYAQKRYLIDVVERSEKIRSEALDARRQQEVDMEHVERQESLEAFVKAASGKHHLLSTAVQPGVYRPGAARQGLATVFGSSVEEDLRQLPFVRRVFKTDVLPPSSQSARGGDDAAADAGGAGTRPGATTRHTDAAGRMQTTSLAASASYSAARDNERLERAIDEKMTARLHPTKFVARRPEPAPPVKTLRAESEYVENSVSRFGRR